MFGDIGKEIMHFIRLVQITDSEERQGYTRGLLRKVSIWWHRFRIMGLLHALDDHHNLEERGDALWGRCVKAVIEILYGYREIVFTNPKTFKNIPRGAEAVPSGISVNIEPTDDFAEIAAFIGSVGGSENDRYGISFRLYADTARPKPVYLYEFRVLKTSEVHLCRVAAVFQSVDEFNNSRSYPIITLADIVYKGDMALGLAKTFHELSGYPVPVEVAGCLPPSVVDAPKYKY